MDDSLVLNDGRLPETREQSISTQFFGWERRGRGWQLYDFPVELEPPFRPFYFFEPAEDPVTDDGRVSTFFSRLLTENKRESNNEGLSVKDESALSLRKYEEFLAVADEPEFCRYYHADFDEIRLVLPNDFKVSRSISEQLLLSLTYAAHPISFEVIGSAEQIVFQFAATKDDASQLKQQLKAHLPACSFSTGAIETEEYLSDSWLAAGNCPVIVDFGLSEEFMLPLAVAHNLETDPLIAIVGAMSNLQEDETAIFQILLGKAKFDWTKEVMETIACFEGTGFFDYIPDLKYLTKQKFGHPLFAVVVRAAAKSSCETRSMQILRNIGGGLAQVAKPSVNELIPLSNDAYATAYHEQALLNRQSFRCGMLLNSEELVSLVHPPSSSIQTTKLVRSTEKTKQAPSISVGHTLELGENRHRDRHTAVTLSNEQRTRHVHVVGSSGSGKSTLLLNLIKQDLENEQGLCVIDPHGDLIDDVLANIPDLRIKDVIFFDPSDSDYPIGLNILQAKSDLEKTILSSDLVATFRRMSTSWGDVMDSVLANAVLAIVESNNGGTLFDLKRFLIEKQFRDQFLKSVNDDSIRYFWTHEFPMIASKPQASILIRLDTFLRQKLVRNIVCQRETKLNFREAIDNRKILLIKLSQGLIGEENSHLLGSLLVSKIYQAALSRQDTQNRPHFWLYLDEFQHFITPSMESILSGSRKYNLGLILSHQEFRQLHSRNQDVASSVLSNCYTRVCFRLGDADAEKFAGGFSFFDSKSLQNLGIGESIARIERSENDFNLLVPNLPKVGAGIADQRKADIIRSTREKYALPKAEVEMQHKTAQAAVGTSMPKTEGNIDTETLVEKVFVKTRNKEHVVVQRQSLANAQSEESISSDSPPVPAATSIQQSQQHRYLQSLVKRMAENQGFRVTIEKEVFGGIGRIDVALEDGTRRIACEISVTNAPEYEIQNIQKCVSAGYAPVLMISADSRRLDKIRQKAKATLSDNDFAIAEFLTPEELFSWLEDHNAHNPESDEKVKGFKVKVNRKRVDQAEQSTRRRAITDVVFGALKKLKNKGRRNDSDPKTQ